MGRTWVELILEREAQLGADTIVRMAKIFVADAKTQLNAIGSALLRNELATARNAAHQLRTNAGSLCFIILEDSALECEQACINGDLAKATAVHRGLPALVDICVVQLRGRYQLG